MLPGGEFIAEIKQEIETEENQAAVWCTRGLRWHRHFGFQCASQVLSITGEGPAHRFRGPDDLPVEARHLRAAEVLLRHGPADAGDQRWLKGVRPKKPFDTE